MPVWAKHACAYVCAHEQCRSEGAVQAVCVGGSGALGRACVGTVRGAVPVQSHLQSPLISKPGLASSPRSNERLLGSGLRSPLCRKGCSRSPAPHRGSVPGRNPTGCQACAGNLQANSGSPSSARPCQALPLQPGQLPMQCKPPGLILNLCPHWIRIGGESPKHESHPQKFFSMRK